MCMRSLSSLCYCYSLEVLHLDGCRGLGDLGGLEGCRGKLRELVLDGCSGLRSLSALTQATCLRTLSIAGCCLLPNLHSLAGCSGESPDSRCWFTGVQRLVLWPAVAVSRRHPSMTSLSQVSPGV